MAHLFGEKAEVFSRGDRNGENILQRGVYGRNWAHKKCLYTSEAFPTEVKADGTHSI